MLDTRFGLALVITTTDVSGSLKLGFRVDPEEKLQTVFKELKSVASVYANNPIYGVEYKWSSYRENEDRPEASFLDDIEEIEEPKSEMTNVLAAYLADDGYAKDRPPVYSPELGLAIEKIKDGFTLQKLWEVIPP